MLNHNLIQQVEDKILSILENANKMQKNGDLQTAESLEEHINFEEATLLNTLVLRHKNSNDHQTLLYIINSYIFDKFFLLDKEYNLNQDSKEILENTIILRTILTLIKPGNNENILYKNSNELSKKIKNNFKYVAPILHLHLNNKTNKEAQEQFNPLMRASIKAKYTRSHETFKNYVTDIEKILDIQQGQINLFSLIMQLMNELCCFDESLTNEVILAIAPKYNNYYTPGGIFSYFMLSTELFEKNLKNDIQIKGLVDFLQDNKSCDTYHEQIIKLNTETQLKIVKEISCRTELTGYTLHYLCILIQKKLTPEIYKSLSKIKYENLLFTETQIFNIQKMLGTSLQYNLYMFLACINSPITKKIMPPINLSIFRWVDSPLNKSDFLKHYWSQLELKNKDDNMTDYICDVTGTCKEHSSLGSLFVTDSNDETHGWIIDLILSTPELQLNKDSHILKHNENIDKLYFKDITSERNRKFNDMIDTLIERGESKQISNNIEIAD